MCDSYNGWPSYASWHAYTCLTDNGDAWLYERAGEYESQGLFIDALAAELENDYRDFGDWAKGYLLEGLLDWAWGEIDWERVTNQFWEGRIVKESK